MTGAAHVEHLRRTDPILYIIEDRWSDTSSVYIGKTPKFTTSTSEALWQIERRTFDGSKIITEFANHAKWNSIWDNRASYFGAPGGVQYPYDSVTGTFTLSGLNIAGKFTEVPITEAGWTALPPSALSSRNAIAIMNPSSFDCAVGYDPLEAGYKGMPVFANGGERRYDIRENIMIYAKAAPGSGGLTLYVEELS